MMIDKFQSRPTRLYSVSDASESFLKFKTLCEKRCDQKDYFNCEAIEKNIPVYDISSFTNSDANHISALQDEWYHILHTGPGVFVLKNFYPDHSSIDSINDVFNEIIRSESTSDAKGDHFAASGKNARIWNSFQKHALASPASFADYYSNPWLSRVCESWLGPNYQVTAQVNIVRPGGQPQIVHRDYHLGFQTAETCSLVPKGMQVASQFLTLQGAVAHSDMSLESGPTRFLPYSHLHEEGYMAYRLPGYQEYFNGNWVSLPLSKGDAVFFNPALFHAAGENTTLDVDRCANLLQISSPFGKAMETIDTLKVIAACWDELQARFDLDGESGDNIRALVAAVASGYPFPTNLDRRPPAPGGMAPESEADVVMRGLRLRWSKHEIISALQLLRQDSSA